MTPLPQNSLEDARRQLANCVLFRGLVTGERDAAVGRARIRHFAAGETIFLMGSPGGSMMAPRCFATDYVRPTGRWLK